jgi:hypothetical protein
MSWLRAIPFLFTLLAFVLQPASASAFGPAHPEARVSAFELVALASVGASAETSPGLHEGIGQAYDETASGYRFAARGSGRATTRFIDDVTVTSHGRVVGRGTVDVGPTVQAIESGQLAPRNIFQNRPLPGRTTPELPVRPPGYYQEFVHPTPGVRGVGPQRIVRGQGGELYYTPDHYQSFIPLN